MVSKNCIFFNWDVGYCKYVKIAFSNERTNVFAIFKTVYEYMWYVRGVPNLITFFSWWGDRESKYHYKWAIIGPPVKRHLNGVSLAGPWWPNIECWFGSFENFQGIRINIARKPYISVIFQGGGGVPAPCPPSGSANDMDFWTYPLYAQTPNLNAHAEFSSMFCLSQWLHPYFVYASSNGSGESNSPTMASPSDHSSLFPEGRMIARGTPLLGSLLVSMRICTDLSAFRCSTCDMYQNLICWLIGANTHYRKFSQMWAVHWLSYTLFAASFGYKAYSVNFLFSHLFSLFWILAPQWLFCLL